MVEPWSTAGYPTECVDIQNGVDIYDYVPPEDIKIGFAFPPCDHLAGSGAAWFKDKGLEALHQALGLVLAAKRICESSGAPWMIENPVSTLSTYWRKPDHEFHPFQYGGYLDPPANGYTKKTCLWTGNGFKMPRYKPAPITHDNYIHHLPPGPDRKNLRSITPMGFARAVFEANDDSRAKCLNGDDQ